MASLQQQSLLSDLIVLAHADNKVTAQEYDFIHRLAQRMEVSKEAVDALFENPVPSKPIFSELERITHFHKLILVMNVDGEIHPSEVATLRNFGLRMGIRQAAIDQILEEMTRYENNLIPSQELIKIFQTYYN